MKRSRLISAAVGIAVAVGQVSAPLLPDHMAPFVGSLRTANYVVTESDLGVPIRFKDLRPDDHFCWRGIVRAGGTQREGEYGMLDARPIQESVNEANIAATRLILSDLAVRAMPLHRNAALWDLGPCSREVRRWAWLFENGHAGWRSAEASMEWGRDAEWHWDGVRGARPGRFMCSQGWTKYNANGGGSVRPCLVFPTAKQMEDPESLMPLLASVSVSVIGWTSYGATVSPATVTAYVSESGNDGAAGTEVAPKLTLAAGLGMCTAGHADWVLLKRGDDWADERFALGFVWGGVDEDEPFRIGSYSTGNRPRIDIRNSYGVSGIGANSGTGMTYISIQDLDIWSSTYVGADSTGDAAFSILGRSNSIAFENNVVDGITLALSFTKIQNDELPDDITFRRNYIHHCFNVGAAQSGGGCLIGEVQTGITLEENVMHHNGWHETKVILTTTESSHSGANISMAAGSATDSAYIGVSVTVASATNGPFICTAYTGSTKTMTLTPTPDTITAGTAVELTGAPKNIFRHALYVQTDNVGYVARRNIVTDSADNNMGRCYGHIYHNVSEGGATQIGGGRTTTYGSTPGIIEQNCVMGYGTDDSTRYPISGYTMIDFNSSGIATGVNLTISDNIIHSELRTNASASVYGIDAASGASTTLTISSNIVYDIYDSGYSFGQAVRLDGTATTAVVISSNTINQKHAADKLISLVNGSAFASLTATSNAFTGQTSSAKFDFLGTNPATFAQWVSFSGETGSFTTSAGGMTVYSLADWSSARGGAATRAAAVTRLSGFDRASGSWKRIDHDPSWVVNWIRGSFGKSLIAYADLPYPMTVANFQATLGGSDMATTWDDPGTPDNHDDIDHYSILKDSVEAGTAVSTATSKTIVGGGAGHYQIRVVDWNGVEYALSEVLTGPSGLVMTDGATSTTGNFVAPDPTGGAQHVYRSLNGTGPFVLIQTLAADAITFTDTLNT